MRKEGKYLYRLDEVGKIVVLGLYSHGKAKTLSQYLHEAGLVEDNSRQVEIAISLESLELIKDVSYKLPLEIRAQLTPLGEKLAKSLMKPRKNTIRSVIENAKRHLGGDLNFSPNT